MTLRRWMLVMAIGLGSLVSPVKASALVYQCLFMWDNSSFRGVGVDGVYVPYGVNVGVNTGDIVSANWAGFGCPTSSNKLGSIRVYNANNQIVTTVDLVLPAGYKYGEWIITFDPNTGNASASFYPFGSTPCQQH